MEWIKRLDGQLVALDTAPLIYFIEAHAKYLGLVEPFFEALAAGRFQAITSTLTLLEVLVQPLQKGDSELAAQYRQILLGSAGLTIVSLSTEVAERAATIRAASSAKTPDAIQLAIAQTAGAQFFLTNDLRLPQQPGLEILVLDRLLTS
jgi:predicted nucleic acid-binding protein